MLFLLLCLLGRAGNWFEQMHVYVYVLFVC